MSLCTCTQGFPPLFFINTHFTPLGSISKPRPVIAMVHCLVCVTTCGVLNWTRSYNPRSNNGTRVFNIKEYHHKKDNYNRRQTWRGQRIKLSNAHTKWTLSSMDHAFWANYFALQVANAWRPGNEASTNLENFTVSRCLQKLFSATNLPLLEHFHIQCYYL